MARILLRGAQVITMAPHRPDTERIDILVEDDRIAAMGDHLDRTGVDVVDLQDHILIPGLVNAHLHTWQSALRFAGGDWSLLEYLAHTHGHVARRYGTDDMYIGTLAGALNQINCGTTTVGDWCHNCLTPAHADAAIDALNTVGIRAVFFHGTPHGGPTKPHDVSEVDRLLGGPITRNPLLTLGMAIKGPQLSAPDVAIADLRAAVDRGLIASMHQSAGTSGRGWNAVGTAGLWGPHANIVHGTGLADQWVKKLADVGVTFTTTPENELGQGHCTAITERLLHAGGAPSLGTDTETAVSGEVLTAARITLAHQRGLAHEKEFHRTGLSAPTAGLTSKQALSWATVHGARALGLADKVGHLAPGMQADLVVIDARALNLWPAHDPIAAALQASIANIEAVMIGGRWRKRHYTLVDTDIDEVKDRLQQSGERFAHKIRATGPLARTRRRVVRTVVRRHLRRQIRSGD
ncbi:amidohydrolase family protein [Mycolicibacterium wolinskyi]|uniref:Cytosine deaminase n=1 Tax=Mycolicibacterium wolinskyi TaxID=59750 RepID=A0A1X2EVS1_9MYCO|nr:MULTISPECIES: amidohydrolase family protein [Mycolicibacterium]MCV7285804.1 amidohydrolase family protein [Mycolicibacterium wolinskyi]MCV7297138.1 amidohydrolase family protein [Mycolicibacterium goodii]ORX10341.1 cytosine deaminase [Mycolicibacterium wolinskyi]